MDELDRALGVYDSAQSQKSQDQENLKADRAKENENAKSFFEQTVIPPLERIEERVRAAGHRCQVVRQFGEFSNEVLFRFIPNCSFYENSRPEDWAHLRFALQGPSHFKVWQDFLDIKKRGSFKKKPATTHKEESVTESLIEKFALEIVTDSLEKCKHL